MLRKYLGNTHWCMLKLSSCFQRNSRKCRETFVTPSCLCHQIARVIKHRERSPVVTSAVSALLTSRGACDQRRYPRDQIVRSRCRDGDSHVVRRPLARSRWRRSALTFALAPVRVSFAARLAVGCHLARDTRTGFTFYTAPLFYSLVTRSRG